MRRWWSCKGLVADPVLSVSAALAALHGPRHVVGAHRRYPIEMCRAHLSPSRLA